MNDSSQFIPNSFQMPNAYIDLAMQYLTGDEFKVLVFTVRHIMGWRERVSSRKAHISLATYENGYNDMGGTGLSRGALLSILKTLETYKFIKRANETSKNSSRGQLWELLFEPDVEGLQARHAERQARDTMRTTEATKRRLEKRTQTAGNVTGTSDVTSNVARTSTGTSDVTSTGTSDVPNQTHLSNTLSNTSFADASASASQPAEKPAVSAPTSPPVDAPAPNAKKARVPTTPASPPLETSDPKPKKPRVPTAQQAMFEAICKAFKYDMARMTSSEVKRVGKVAAELVGAGYAPLHVPIIYGHCTDSFDNFTVNALATSASDAMTAYKELTGIDPLREVLITDAPPETPTTETPLQNPPVADGVNYFDISEAWDNADKLIGGG